MIPQERQVMRLLLGSGGFRTEERRELLVEQMRWVFGSVKTILFIPYAIVDHDWYVAAIQTRGLSAGYEIQGIHTFEDPVTAIEQAEGIYMGGGNTFLLTRELHRYQLLEPIRQRVGQGIPYMGVSAGTNVACPTMQTTNDMPVVQPPSYETLHLVDFQVNAHYFPGGIYFDHDGKIEEHYGETRDDRIREYHQHNPYPVVGLWEGGCLRIEGETMELVGNKARIFRKGETPMDVQPGQRWELSEFV